MTTTLPCDGSTACLGYDCWFQLSRVGIDVYPRDGECVVSLYSTEAEHPLRGMLHMDNPEELRTLIGGLAHALALLTAGAKESPV